MCVHVVCVNVCMCVHVCVCVHVMCCVCDVCVCACACYDDVLFINKGVMVVSGGPIEIPPQSPSWDVHGICSADCTRRNMPPEGITLFTMGHHAHLAGRQMLTQQIRNGTKKI